MSCKSLGSIAFTENLLGLGSVPLNRVRRVAITSLLVTTCACAQTPTALLEKADHLADSFNLVKAQPLYREAETGFHLAGDADNELRARLGQLRYRVQLGRYTESRVELQRILAIPMVESDPDLKIRALEILGNIDMNQNLRAALND